MHMPSWPQCLILAQPSHIVLLNYTLDGRGDRDCIYALGHVTDQFTVRRHHHGAPMCQSACPLYSSMWWLWILTIILGLQPTPSPCLAPRTMPRVGAAHQSNREHMRDRVHAQADHIEPCSQVRFSFLLF